MSDQVMGQCAWHVFVLGYSFLDSQGEEVPSGMISECLYLVFLI